MKFTSQTFCAIVALALQAATSIAAPIVADDALATIYARELLDFAEMELSRRSNEDYLLFVRDIVEARAFDDLIELEARAVRRAGKPGGGGRKRGGQGFPRRKSLTHAQRRTRKRAATRARQRARRRAALTAAGAGNQASAAAPNPAPAPAAPASNPSNMGQAVWGARPPNPYPQGAHAVTAQSSGSTNQWHLPARISSLTPQE